MKRKSVSLIVLLLAALGGCGLRYWNLTAGVDAQGLPRTGHLSAYLMAGWCMLCLAVFIVLARTSQGRSRAHSVMFTGRRLAVLGYLGAGVALLPLSAAVFGFSLSFSVCCFTASFGGAGVLLAMAVFGIRSLASVPGFFLLAVPALRSAALRSPLPFGRGKRVASAGNNTGRWKGLCAVSAALLAALLLEAALSPGLLRLVWEHFIAA